MVATEVPAASATSRMLYTRPRPRGPLVRRRCGDFPFDAIILILTPGVPCVIDDLPLDSVVDDPYKKNVMRYSAAFSASHTRRRLVALGGAAALWSVFGRPAKAQPPGRRPTIGVNSYSVRASMTGHAQSTLRQLKQIGFEEVELVGEKELDHATPMSRQLGLGVLSLHVWDLFDPGDGFIPMDNNNTGAGEAASR